MNGDDSDDPTHPVRPTVRLPVNVLVVDDDYHFRVLARSLLEASGYVVTESDSLRQCISLLRCQVVNVILLDMFMPDVNGFKAVEILKRRFPNIPIVAVSGATDADGYLLLSKGLGADASLEKARIEELCALLKAVLESSRCSFTNECPLQLDFQGLYGSIASFGQHGGLPLRRPTAKARQQKRRC